MLRRAAVYMKHNRSSVTLSISVGAGGPLMSVTAGAHANKLAFPNELQALKTKHLSPWKWHKFHCDRHLENRHYLELISLA